MLPYHYLKYESKNYILFTLPDPFVEAEKYSIEHNQTTGIKSSNLNTSDRLLGTTKALILLLNIAAVD